MKDIKKEYEIKGWDEGKIIKLLPCPFCGGEPELLHIGNDYKPKKRLTIKCKNCRIERTDATLRYGFDWLENVAQNQWNNRSWIEQKLKAESFKYFLIGGAYRIGHKDAEKYEPYIGGLSNPKSVFDKIWEIENSQSELKGE